MPTHPNSPYLFVGGNSRVFALDKSTGGIAWDIQLKSGWFKTGKDFVTLSEGVDYLFAFSHGIAFCLDKESGTTIWQREISELKHHVASLAVDATLLGVSDDRGKSDTAAMDCGDGGDGGDGDGGGD
jgi:outer membrane protein assembly factor BamB